MTFIEALRVAIEAIKEWMEGKLNAKVNTYQGVDNANKILSVGGDGTVVPVTNMVYVGPDRPADPNVKVWINTSEQIEDSEVIYVLPRIATITLMADAWVKGQSYYSQSIDIATVTATSKVDLQPTYQQIYDLQDAEISLMIENDNGVLTCYAIGNVPNVDYTMQVLIQEVTYL